MEHTKTKGCLDSLTLKLLAMALMLCDHLWATVLPLSLIHIFLHNLPDESVVFRLCGIELYVWAHGR